MIRSKVLRVNNCLVVCWFKNKYITRQKGQFPVQLVAAAERFTGKPNITINHHRLSAENEIILKQSNFYNSKSVPSLTRQESVPIYSKRGNNTLKKIAYLECFNSN